MRVIQGAEYSRTEMEKLLSKPSFDKLVLDEKMQQGICDLFGKPLTVTQVVDNILAAVRERGLQAVLEYTKLIDKVELSPENIEVTQEEIASAVKEIPYELQESLQRAAENIRRFHQEQLPRSWFSERAQGALLGQKLTALDRVGIYVPGGTAAYPSSVLMNAIPAQVAGVKEIIMAVPPGPEGKIPPLVLFAAKEAGVHRIFRMGGAQAVAALAFGADLIPKVDKITGPGNIFVALAKRAVYGHVDIDMLAGPSEILILADGTARADFIAADMLSQAEHDRLAHSVLITTQAELAEQVQIEVKRQLALLPRAEIAEASLANHGMIILAPNLDQALDWVNLSAAEHLEILTENPFALLPRVRHAGAIFLGPWSPEPLGDYYAGPNHVLPTGGTARYASVLNVETFMKKTSIIAYTQAALLESCEDGIRLAKAEGLVGHARALQIRQECGK